MATKQSETGVYRVTEIIGTSNVSWEDAAKTAVETAAKSLRDLRVAEVTKLDMKIEGGPPREGFAVFQVRSLMEALPHATGTACPFPWMRRVASCLVRV